MGARIDCLQSIDRLCTVNGTGIGCLLLMGFGIDCVPSIGVGIDCVPAMVAGITVY